jgi:holliday junction DNA helicase RuvB
MNERMIAPRQHGDESEQESSLRPKSLAEFVGQDHLKENLSIALEAAKKRGEAIDHCLFAGPPGLGKTTLANIIAHEMGSHLHITSGPVLEKASDLAGMLTQLEEGDILFIDEIHRLPRIVEEYLYPAMEDFRLDIMLDSGPASRSINLPLKRFTLVGATTRSGMLTSPLRDRFGLHYRLDLYDDHNLRSIMLRSGRILNVPLEEDASELMSGRCRGTPRIANRILRRCRDMAQVRGNGVITAEVAQKTLHMLGIDSDGLDEMDRRILRCIMEKFNGGPVGLSTMSAALGEESDTLEEVYEPFLIQQGLLKRTPRGRMATLNAFRKFNQKVPTNYQDLQEDLFTL